MTPQQEPRRDLSPVGIYKDILRRVMDNRPSGTRQRLAEALGKNKSFVSQIANPAYPVPVPAQHIEAIFHICHFSPADKDAFLAAYRRAHPGRLEVVAQARAMRHLVINVPDFGDAARNRALDDLFHDMAQKLTRLTDTDN
jgi:hypothetical protein